VSFSLTVDPISFMVADQKDYSFFVGLETRHSRDFKEKVKLGVEFEYKNVMILRTGYMGNYDERGLTPGIGFQKEYFNSKFQFDYGYQDFGVFNEVHVFSFGVTY